ncbi:hypothetical protein D9M72_486870 [compost metagenome]
MGIVDGYRQLAAPFGVTVDGVFLEGLQEAVHVFLAKPLERGDVLGEDAHGIRKSVHDRSRDDAARPARGAVGDRTLFDQHDVDFGLALFRLDGTP